MCVSSSLTPATKTTNHKMKVQGITIRNFKGIQHESLSIKGNNVYVLGRNATGKTSFLDAIFKILAGKNMPSMPTTQGARSGDIEIDLGEIIVRAKFNSKNEKVSVSVESKDGSLYKEPRTMLNELLGVIDFDLNKFYELSPKKQVEFIKQMAGIDFTDIDDAYKKAFDERTFINRKASELEARMGVWDKDNIILTDLTEATKILNEKRAFNIAREEGEKTILDYKARQDEITNELAILRKKIQDLNEEFNKIEDGKKEGDAWLNDPANARYDIEAEEAAFLAAVENNKVIQKNIDNQILYTEFLETLAIQKKLNETLELCQATKETAIKEANLPVPGLSFNDDGLIYNGLPFEASQINKAKQIIIGLQINLALLGEVKIARFEGSLIDDENMEYIEDWAQKNGLQLFVEIVDRTAESLKIEVKEVL